MRMLAPGGASSTLLQRLIFVFAVAIFVGGCAIRLAPPYDADIEKDTATLEKTVEQFFETQANDPSKRSYAANKQFYIDTIATMNNLTVRSKARWTGGARFNPVLGLPGVPDTLTVRTSNEEAEMFSRLAQVMENIRAAHELYGFRDTNISVYREQLRVGFTAILQYESYLKR